MEQKKPRFFDSHIHLSSESLQQWFEKYAENYKSDWVFNNVSTNLEDFRIAWDQANKYDNVFLTAGIHPLEIDDLEMEDVINELDSKINEKVIAIGETGLDFYRGSKELDYEKQRRWFVAHYWLAKKHNLPLMLHIRNAHEEALDILSNVFDWFGVIHCYEGDLETAKRYLELPGKWMISVSPIVFRKDSKLCRSVIREIDISRLLVETDSPYLAKDFGKVVDIVKLISDEKEIEFEECKRLLWNNFCSFFKLKL